MRFTADALPGLVEGRVTSTFRRWKRTQVKVGGTYRPYGLGRALQVDAAPKLATVAAAQAAAETAGLEADVEHRQVPFPDLDATALIAWRLGLAQHAPFFDGIPTDADRSALVEDAAARLGNSWPPLERSIIILRALRY